jgi:hypothetical protein
MTASYCMESTKELSYGPHQLASGRWHSKLSFIYHFKKIITVTTISSGQFFFEHRQEHWHIIF